MRTPEQIMADLEARYTELEREAERRANCPKLNFPCVRCKWYLPDKGWKNEETQHRLVVCNNALVKGFGPAPQINFQGIPKLCGDEKALWEPRLSRLERIYERLARFIGLNH